MFGAPSGGVSGYNYFGSLAILVCIGPVKRLLAIRNGDTDIFTGPIDSTSADADGKSTLATEIGTIDFYWGTATQEVNALLNTLEIDVGGSAEPVPMPAFRHCAYVVLQNADFGNQVTPPTLKFEIETETSGLAISAHSIDGDSVIPEAVYQYLTNSLFGAGIPESEIDAASFVAAAEQVIDEGLGASPDLDSSESIRETIGRMLAHVEGHLYFHEGKLRLRLVRQEDTSGAPTVTPADLLDEPLPNNKLFSETWNLTHVAFRDRDAKWEDTIEPYRDPANSAIVSQEVLKEFSFPYLTTRPAAKILAKLLGVKGGIPPVFWTLELKPKWRTLAPGQLFKLTYPRLGIANKVCRITEIQRGGPNKPAVQVTCVEEQTRDTSHDYVPPEDNFLIPGTVDPTGLYSTTPRLSCIPDALKNGRADGMLIAFERPNETTTGAKIFGTWDPVQVAYQRIGDTQRFPVKCQLVAWWRIRDDHWMLRVRPDTAHDLDRLQILAQDVPEWYAVVGRRDYKSVGTPKDEHQTLSPWLTRTPSGVFDLVADNLIDVEVQGGAFGSPDLLLETAGDDGRYPTLHCYFGTKADFMIRYSDTLQFDRGGPNAPDDTDLKIHIKVTTGTWKAEQSLADVTAVVYDRDDPTMCPGGTFSRTWGERAPTAYELLDLEGGAAAAGEEPSEAYSDVEDLDLALGAILDGTATEYQTLLAEHIDQALGAMSSTSQTYYNE